MWTVHTSPAGMVLFSQVRHLDWDFWLPVGALIGVVALGIWAFVRVKRWRAEIAEDGVPDSPTEQLANYQKMVDDGLLDPEEFARIKARMEMIASPLPPKISKPQLPANQPPDTSFREE